MIKIKGDICNRLDIVDREFKHIILPATCELLHKFTVFFIRHLSMLRAAHVCLSVSKFLISLLQNNFSPFLPLSTLYYISLSFSLSLSFSYLRPNRASREGDWLNQRQEQWQHWRRMMKKGTDWLHATILSTICSPLRCLFVWFQGKVGGFC